MSFRPISCWVLPLVVWSIGAQAALYDSSSRILPDTDVLSSQVD